MKDSDITQAQFKEEGKHQWALNHKGYRIVVRKADGSLEIIIREKLTNNPDPEDWDKALQTVNAFYKKLRVADSKT